MSSVLLDSHTLLWLSDRPAELSSTALSAIRRAGEICVSGVTWYELELAAHRGRIRLDIPVSTWLAGMGAAVRTVPVTAPIAGRAAALPAPFARDPFDRIIFATAVENGWPLLTKDRRMRRFPQPHPVTLW